jgi:hypothetical protein
LVVAAASQSLSPFGRLGGLFSVYSVYSVVNILVAALPRREDSWLVHFRI